MARFPQSHRLALVAIHFACSTAISPAQGSSIETLLTSLHDPDPTVRAAATTTLPKLDQPESLPTILAAWDAAGADQVVHDQLVRTLGTLALVTGVHAQEHDLNSLI